MKLLRFLLKCLVVAAALSALVVLAAIAPTLQTWAAQALLAGQSGVHGSLGSLSAGFGRVDIEGLRLEENGAVLTVPALQASLPVTSSLLGRRAFMRGLVAKGWTLDLSHAPVASGVQGAVGAEQARAAASAVAGILSGWSLPCDVSLDGAELEGDVILAPRQGGTPVRLHVALTGGGLGAGREGAFEFDAAAADLPGPVDEVQAHGRLVASMDTPRSVGRLGLTAEVTCKGASLSGGFPLSLAGTAARAAGGETYTLDLGRGGRHVVQLALDLADSGRRLTGTWRVDLRDGDLGPFLSSRTLPSLAATGDGRIDSDSELSQVRLRGHVDAVGSHLGALAPPLERLGTVALGADLESECTGRTLRVGRMKLSFASTRPILLLEALQPFTLDLSSGGLAVSDAGKDVLVGSVRGFPLALLSTPGDRIGFASGEATGDFTVRTSPGGFAVRMASPLVASGVSLQSPSALLGEHLDLSAALAADCSSGAWQVRLSPLAIASAGRSLATLELKASQGPDSGSQVAVAGTFKADLAALALQPVNKAIGWIAGRSASGEFTGSVGGGAVVDCKLAVAGNDSRHAVTADVHAEIDPDGYVEFLVPVRVEFGPSVSEVTAKGSLTLGASGNRLDGRLTGRDVTLEHLRLLLGPVAAAGGAPFPDGGAPAPAAGERDRLPFWGSWSGRVYVFFNLLRTPGGDVEDLGATLTLMPGSVRVDDGRFSLPNRFHATAQGSVAFDPTAASPYSLNAVAKASDIEAGSFFAKPQPGEDLPLEGKFALSGTFASTGMNLPDLLGRSRAEFQLSSPGGIFRFLKTNVADSIPQASTPVPDALGGVGSVVGAILGVKGNVLESVKNPVSKAADAAIDITYNASEIGYDKMTVAAVLAPDGSVVLEDIELTAPEEHLHGSGRISGVKGQPFTKEPLSVDLEFGAKDHIAELLSKAGLLSAKKDAVGYSLLNQTLHFGGTLQQVDVGQWHDLLAKAAAGDGGAPKKGG